MLKNKITTYKIPLILRVVILFLFLLIPTLTLNLFPINRNHTSASATNMSATDVNKITPLNTKLPIIQGTPMSLQIPKLSINLQVKSGGYHYSTNDWILDNDNLFFIPTTVEPNNQSGLSIFYGHNTQKVLGKTNNLVPGDEMLIEIDSGELLLYRFTHQELVEPDDASILSKNNADHKVVLLSCYGLFDEKRRLMYFDFAEVKEDKELNKELNV